ncbi:MAG: GAF domain-containing protein [Ktedonobacteraceae bacterium]
MSDDLDQEKPRWQDVFQKIIKPPKERQRIAAALGVHKITLERWSQKGARPQHDDLVRLIKIVQPQDRADLLAALQATYPDIYEKLQAEISAFVPSSFMREILRSRAAIIGTQRPWQVCTVILDEAIRLLDPHQLGMSITPAFCMPPVNGTIRSLREQGGRGILPWTFDLEHKSLFLGLRSLAAYVTQTGRARSVQDISKETYIPVFAYPEDLEHSAAASPLWFEGKIAGCLLAASLHTDHFTQARMDLLTDFANIFALVLHPDDFYEHRLVQLRYMPLPEKQTEILQTFRPRVTQQMMKAGLDGQYIDSNEAESIAWQEIEDALLLQGMHEKEGAR